MEKSLVFFDYFNPKYPNFIKIIEDYYRFFMVTENKYSLLNGTRDYELCNKMMKFIFDTFAIEHSSKEELTSYFEKNSKSFYSDIAEVQKAYLDKVIKIKELESTNNKEYRNIKQKMADARQYDSKNQAETFDKIIRNLDNVPNTPNVADECDETHNDDTPDVVSALLLFVYMQTIYENIYNNEQKPIKHIATYDAFTSEFHMFASHFAFAYVVYSSKRDKCSKYIRTNILKALNHLNRASFDTLKILASSIAISVCNGKELDSLIAIRQNEVFNLSLSLNDRMFSYLKWMKDTCHMKDNKKLLELIEYILSQHKPIVRA